DLSTAVRVLKSKHWSVPMAIQAYYEPGYAEQLDSGPPLPPLAAEQEPQSQLRRRRAAASDEPSSEPHRAPQQTPQVGFSWRPLFIWPLDLVFKAAQLIIRLVLGLLGLQHIASQGVPRQLQQQIATETSTQYFDHTFGSTHPEFFTGTFAQAQAQALRDSACLVAVVWSRHHDDTALFARALQHERLMQLLADGFVLWLGDVATGEAAGMGLVVGAAAYPFVAVLVPKEEDAGAMRVVARCSGVPSRRSAAALADALAELIRVPVERHGQAMRAARRRREEQAEARRILEQQDSAYQASLARDRLRVEEARLREVQEQQRLQGQQDEQRRREQWRWATFGRLQRQKKETQEEAAAAAAKGGEPQVGRVGLRLEDGERAVLMVRAQDSVQSLFDFVETRAVACEWERVRETPFGPLHAVHVPEGYVHEHDFVLVSQFPRAVFDDRAASLGEALAAKGLWPSAALIVEPLFEPET
ncbi:Ubx domain-containing protein, partial [Kickxella alabastrina]